MADRLKEVGAKTVSQRTEAVHKAEPLGESAQHDEARPEVWGDAHLKPSALAGGVFTY